MKGNDSCVQEVVFPKVLLTDGIKGGCLSGGEFLVYLISSNI